MRMVLIIVGIVTFVFLAGCQTQPEKEQEEESADEVQVETAFAEVEGARLYYEVAGTGEPVVLVHGNQCDSRVWEGQFETLAKNYRVIRYDVRGFGRSSLPEENAPYSHSSDLAALLEDSGIENAHIIGWSMGSGIAIDFVLSHPEMSRSLVAVGPWLPGYSSAATAWISETIAKVVPILGEYGTRTANVFWYSLPSVIRAYPNEEVLKGVSGIGNDYSFWHLTHEDPVTYLEPAAMERIDQISVPTLIVTAEDDYAFCREITDLLKVKLPTSLKIVMGGTGHAMFMHEPDKFNRIVLTFLTSAAGRQGTQRSPVQKLDLP